MISGLGVMEDQLEKQLESEIPSGGCSGFWWDITEHECYLQRY